MKKTSAAAADPSGPFVLPDWPAPATIGALTTTRRGGHSLGPYGAFNLALHVGDDARAVLANRGALVSRLGLPRSPRWLDQVHGARVIAAADAGPVPEADGAWTSVRGVACAVLTADCLPILLCDQAGTRVAALHCGWRGIARGVIAAGIAALAHPPEGLLAWLGPAIGAGYYEVDAPVRDAFNASSADLAEAFSPSRPGHWHLDLYRAARLSLGTLGVRAVYGGEFCTHGQPDRFYSHRRDGTTGRMASLIWVRR
ncbi:MAG: peptidoglycan editing factor PgeF [Gammaproteobacteria bacterium]